MEEQLKRQKKYYSQVAQSIGNHIRHNLIQKQKSQNRQKPKYRISQYAHSINSIINPNNRNKSISKPQSPFQLYNTRKIRFDKIQTVREFKQKLKTNLEESRSKRQEKIYELANKVRQNKYYNMKNKQYKFQGLANKKKNQVKMMKGMLEKSMQYLRMTKRQIQLQQTFQCFQRRLRTSHYLNTE